MVVRSIHEYAEPNLGVGKDENDNNNSDYGNIQYPRAHSQFHFILNIFFHTTQEA